MDLIATLRFDSSPPFTTGELRAEWLPAKTSVASVDQGRSSLVIHGQTADKPWSNPSKIEVVNFDASMVTLTTGGMVYWAVGFSVGFLVVGFDVGLDVGSSVGFDVSSASFGVDGCDVDGFGVGASVSMIAYGFVIFMQKAYSNRRL